MALPNRDKAHVPPRKLNEYLLSVTHLVGRSKARFFRGLGFDEDSLGLLQGGLLAIAHREEVKDTIIVISSHGTKYIIEGELPTPVSGSVSIRTVWIVEPDDPEPRFVTAYPV